MNSTINSYTNILNQEEMSTCFNILAKNPGYESKSSWRFGFKSDITNNLRENIPFWKLSLDDSYFFKQTLFDRIQKITEMNFELLEVYCNGQSHGQDGHPHVDDVHGETHSFIYYANPNWNLTYGGQTVFLVDNKKIGIDPHPNTGILFTTDLMHYGEAFNQFCRDLRMTVVYKLKLKPITCI